MPLFFPMTITQADHKQCQDPACCVYAHIHEGSRPCRNKALVKLINRSPEHDHN